MRRLVIALSGAWLLSGCGAGSETPDDDDIVSGDGDSDGDVDRDSGSASDGEADSDADGGHDAGADGDIDLPGVGQTWTEPVEVDVDVACEGTPCSGPELRLAGGESHGHCAQREGFEARMIVANCGDLATAEETLLALYYGPEGADPVRDGTLLTAGTIPRGLGSREAVAVNFALTDEEWAIAVAPRGYFVIDPDDLVVECFEDHNVDEYGSPNVVVGT